MATRCWSGIPCLVALAVLGVPTATLAAPVYLECTTYNEHSAKTTSYKITLDESAQTATFTDDGFTQGNTVTRRAQFAQNEVTFTYEILKGFPVTYRIDRVSLEFSAAYPNKKGDRGTCKVSTPVERAF
jgi:hypothetical protein